MKINLIPKIFQCVTNAQNYDQAQGILDPHALKYVIIKYWNTKEIYKYYHLLSKKYFIYIDVNFSEHNLFNTINISLEQKNISKDDDVKKEGINFLVTDINFRQITPQVWSQMNF